MQASRRRLLAELTLGLVAVLWGTTFIVTKDVIRTVPVHGFLALRFGIGALAIAPLALAEARRGRLAGQPTGLSKASVIGPGVLLGLFLFMGYEFQTLGLIWTTTSKSAFITATHFVWMPLLTLVWLRRRPQAQIVTSIAVALAGLAMLCFGNAGITGVTGIAGEGGGLFTRGELRGDLLTLACAVAFVFHIFTTGQVSGRWPTMQLTLVQLSVVAVASLVVSLLAGEILSLNEMGSGEWLGIAYLGLVTSAFAFWAQTRVQRHTTPERAAIIFLGEPVVAAAVGAVILAERLTLVQWLGAALIGVAILVIEGRRVWPPRAEPAENQSF